jgi:myo-inositol-1(or 4)-monophosphatase
MEWIPELIQVFDAVRAFLLDRGRAARQHIGVNPKGQDSMGFDVGAEEVVIEILRQRVQVPIRLLSEERGEVPIRPDLGLPRFTLIVDPVDGSENFERGIEMVCFSVAVLPEGAPLAPMGVVAGLIGNVFTGTYQTAIRGGGAVSGQVRLRASSIDQLSAAMVAIEIADDRPGYSQWVRRLPEHLAGLVRAADRTRILGSAVLAQMGVASGGLEAYVDVRGILTPENFMAGALIIEEAGGVVTDDRGQALPVWTDMTAGFPYIASANAAIHREILGAIPQAG